MLAANPPGVLAGSPIRMSAPDTLDGDRQTAKLPIKKASYSRNRRSRTIGLRTSSGLMPGTDACQVFPSGHLTTFLVVYELGYSSHRGAEE